MQVAGYPGQRHHPHHTHTHRHPVQSTPRWVGLGCVPAGTLATVGQCFERPGNPPGTLECPVPRCPVRHAKWHTQPSKRVLSPVHGAWASPRHCMPLVGVAARPLTVGRWRCYRYIIYMCLVPHWLARPVHKLCPMHSPTPSLPPSSTQPTGLGRPPSCCPTPGLLGAWAAGPTATAGAWAAK